MKLTYEQICTLLIHINNKHIRKNNRLSNDLSIYKYSNSCVWDGVWDDVTIMCRGLVLDSFFNIVGNCIPKFFNYEDLVKEKTPNININQPFSCTKKEDGSLIQVFMYNGELQLTSSGGFDNDYTNKAKQLLETKYNYLLPIIESTDRVNFIFELICPLTTVVIRYNDIEELRLITIRTSDGDEPEDFIQQCKELGFDYVQEEYFNTIEDLLKEKKSEFKNIEGYVIKLQDSNRIKVKYDEYFILHKTVTQVTKTFVWESMANHLDINLTNVPDEVFNDIRKWQKEIQDDYELLKCIVETAVSTIKQSQELNKDISRKSIAEFIFKDYKNISGILFRAIDDREYDSGIWNHIKPVTVV